MEEYESILEEIFTRNRFHIKLGLERMEQALEKINNPHKNLKTIHIAGTNGKGSTSAMVKSMLQKSGYKVGIFTSPFLSDFRESIKINSEMISKEEVIKLYHEIKDLDLTYFEFKTAMAFLYFNNKSVDFAVIEVGLGGRLDATNVITPLVSVITNTTKDHVHILGNNIEEIAKEKAGIIKIGIPIITMENGKGFQIIKSISEERKSPLFIVKEEGEYIQTNLNGKFQQSNARLAIEVIKVLKENYNIRISDNYKEGLKETNIHGRFERFDNILIDCAHNVPALEMLRDEIKEIKYNKLIIITTMLSDKQIKRMLEIINDIGDFIILTKIDINRASEPEELTKHISKPKEIILNPKKALEFARKKANKNDLILICGSCYLVGELINSLNCKN